ncbi:hypothetical protein TYRP_023030, partial [Tyrophagus putrescentiae]
MEKHRMLEPIEGGSSRDRQARSKASDVHEVRVLAVARAKVPPILRPFWFQNLGWLMVKKHPEVILRGKTIDLNDLEADPIVRFQRKFYIPMVLLFWGILPTVFPVYFWSESAWLAFLTCVIVRYVYTLNFTWLVNSWAHKYGTRPYDKTIAPVETSFIKHLLMGEGFHNYHHVFPWDYSASELGPAEIFNPVTALIDFFALMGWVWDRKKANSKVVHEKMVLKGENAMNEQCISSHFQKGGFLKEWL